MKRVVFYIDHEWAFGSIHYELCKYLFGHGVDAQVLSWKTRYSTAEFVELDTTVDVYMTTPVGYGVLVRDYAVDPAKIVVVVHGIIDFHDLINTFGRQEFARPKQFAVVSEFLKQKAEELGIERTPLVLPLGVNTGRFHALLPKKLATVGYAAAFHRIDGHTQYDLKRGRLVEECARYAGLEFRVAQGYHNSFVTMPGFYAGVDCVITASTEEGAGLPALEAGAAGRLVISTPVGHWPERVGSRGGHEVPIDEAAFVAETVKLLTHYKDNQAAFVKKCRAIQKHAASYDWSQVIDQWTAVLAT